METRHLDMGFDVTTLCVEPELNGVGLGEVEPGAYLNPASGVSDDAPYVDAGVRGLLAQGDSLVDPVQVGSVHCVQYSLSRLSISLGPQMGLVM